MSECASRFNSTAEVVWSEFCPLCEASEMISTCKQKLLPVVVCVAVHVCPIHYNKYHSFRDNLTLHLTVNKKAEMITFRWHDDRTTLPGFQVCQSLLVQRM
jgi:hypothetical protein